ncbi:MAG: hypothetical protein EOP83_34965, partial [Verrucomicrobiaceae bacterium]
MSSRSSPGSMNDEIARKFHLLTTAMLLVPALPAAAASGQVDMTFGDSGRTVVNLRTPSTSGTTVDEATAFAVQPDGKILLGGSSTTNGVFQGPGGVDFSLLRLLPDGTLDPSFGGDGLVTTDFSNGAESIKGVAVQEDGKIVAAGQKTAGSFTDLVIARYLP